MVKAEEGVQDELEPEQFRKIFVGGLSTSTTDEQLKEYYSQWGKLVDCIVMRDPTTKRSRGFGFVSFSKQSEVDTAMANRPHVIDGKTVDPKRAVPRDQSQRSETNLSTKRLYISGVREEHTEEMFEEYFSQFGKVVKAEIILDKATSKPRGFAFISFEDYDPVDKCVLIKSHQINNYRCDVKKALSKEEMARVYLIIFLQERERADRMGRSRGTMRGGPDGGYGSGWGGVGGPAGGSWGGASGGRQSYYGLDNNYAVHMGRVTVEDMVELPQFGQLQLVFQVGVALETLVDLVDGGMERHLRARGSNWGRGSQGWNQSSGGHSWGGPQDGQGNWGGRGY
ncbi:unnamed protein product [Enterobius vermicularis]|uniref:Heterogeneous nuclear ribonucleoprotein A1 n=1 Tax=Enterobius vermicularis TaxID=51028 RepID=A0A0N4VGJ8_ENTVE|nr:unnamed protein product [Enterobius vermicularis]